MKLKDIGEDGLVEQIRLMAGPSGGDVIAGIGDDAAVIKKDGSTLLLFTTDMLVENVHFTREMSFFDIGRKAVGVNLSDIAAMGGSPGYAFASIGIREDMSAGDIRELYEGMLSHAREYGVLILGGDTNRSPESFVLNICLTGEVEKDRLCLRSTARPGDSIFVTGTLGNSALFLEKGEYFPVKPRLKEAEALLDIAKPTSMIDISDGLAKDLKRLCGSSGAGAEILREEIPAAEGASLETALSGGEDFELLFTAPAGREKKLLSEFPAKTGVRLSLIGRINNKDEGIFIVDKKNRRKPLEGGYAHF